MITFNNEWDGLLAAEFAKDYYRQLREFLRAEYAARVIYPSMGDIFNALKLTDYSAVKVVLLGQDPYHGAGQAHGLAFSVLPDVAPPPSLVNIFKELRDDLGVAPPPHGTLTRWAERGVLLLNTCLTVSAGQANSHHGRGWEIFTDAIIQLLNARAAPMAFMLWGSNAQTKRALITAPQHRIFAAPHPSPLSAYRGFFGCRHFSKVNEFLRGADGEAVNWDLLAPLKTSF